MRARTERVKDQVVVNKTETGSFFMAQMGLFDMEKKKENKRGQSRQIREGGNMTDIKRDK